ncbi:MAG: hypothetical protein R3B48_15555 [Kofleriaceae bacterium]
MAGRRVLRDLERIVDWYLATAFGRWEGPGVRPFYVDPGKVGRFAVDLDAVEAREPDALFQLLVTLAAYQSRRDVDIMAIQRAMPAHQAVAMIAPRRLHVLVEGSRCPKLRDSTTFDRGCDVRRDFAHDRATCDTRPRSACHVKDATFAIGRMGDLGKLPTSAWLHLGPSGLARWFAEVAAESANPHKRATAMVNRLTTIFRIGVKLASMFVSALTVPELGIGLAAWSPELDGSRIVVVDANVGRAIRWWRTGRGVDTYAENARWFVAAAREINLSHMRAGLPRASPRFVQQAVYVFRSRSNRVAHGDACATSACRTCPSSLCPFRDRHGEDKVSTRGTQP